VGAGQSGGPRTPAGRTAYCMAVLFVTGPVRASKRFRSYAGRGVKEVLLILKATVDGQTTAHYIADRRAPRGEGAGRRK
jgi:hypothetical protein